MTNPSHTNFKNTGGFPSANRLGVRRPPSQAARSRDISVLSSFWFGGVQFYRHRLFTSDSGHIHEGSGGFHRSFSLHLRAHCVMFARSPAHARLRFGGSTKNLHFWGGTKMRSALWTSVPLSVSAIPTLPFSTCLIRLPLLCLRVSNKVTQRK